MSIHSLPTELLRSILHCTILFEPRADCRQDSPFSILSESEYRERIEFLLSLALVHSSWTPLAQDLLFREVWLKACDDNMPKKAGLLLESWKKTGRRFQTRKLRVEGNLGMLLGLTKDEGIWKGVQCLEHVNRDSVESLDIYSELSSLKILSLHARYHYSHALIDRTISLPNLERFELHYPESYENFIYHDGPTVELVPPAFNDFTYRN